MLHINITVKFLIVKSRKFQGIHKIRDFYIYTPWKIILQENNFDDFCCTNISSNMKILNIIYPVHRVFLWAGDRYPFYMGFYQYVRQ